MPDNVPDRSRSIDASPTLVQPLLRGMPFFADFSDDQLEEVAKTGNLVSRAADHKVFTEGNPGTSLFVIVSGKVRISKTDESGADIDLAILKDGASFGEMALLDDAPRSASATTLEPCVFFELTRAEFLESSSRFPMLIRSELA